MYVALEITAGSFAVTKPRLTPPFRGRSSPLIKKRLNLFEDICRLMTDSSRPQKTLETIVMLVAGRLGIDVCSVYLFDENREQLILRATYGLNTASVGKIRMSPEEGLTGLVVEHQEPVFVTRPSEHPRFKFFENSGEEIYGAFLGLPLVYHQKSFGVIVFQTRDEGGNQRIGPSGFHLHRQSDRRNRRIHRSSGKPGKGAHPRRAPRKQTESGTSLPIRFKKAKKTSFGEYP